MTDGLTTPACGRGELAVMEFFQTSTRNLLSYEAKASVVVDVSNSPSFESGSAMRT
jgi:hypothetical protein